VNHEVENVVGELRRLRDENQRLRELALKYLSMLDSPNPGADLERHLKNPHLTIRYDCWDDGK
jgi:hypothetical protein